MKKIASILLIFLSASSFAQTAQENLRKYWWYRYQLVNDYMKIGPNCGESIPTNRHLDDWDFNSVLRNSGLTIHHMHWGDATIFLGQYMAVLATEYKILQNAGLSTNRTKYEIYYAIKAYNRLDREAEERCRNFDATQKCQNINPQSWDLNGFFIRDDVPESFVENNLRHFNRDKVNHPVDKTMSDVIGRMDNPYNETNPSFGHQTWSQKYGSTPKYPGEMSQDQVAQIYSGLALLVKMLGTNAFYYGDDLQKLAQDAILRLAFQCKGTGNEWIIKNPLTGRCVYGNHPEYYNQLIKSCSDGGAWIFPSAPALSSGLKFLGGSWTGQQWTDIFNLEASANGHNTTHQATKYIANATGQCKYGANQMLFPTIFTAYAKNWKDRGVNTTRAWINRLALQCSTRWPDLPLIYRIIHGGGLKNEIDNKCINILNSAPGCLIYNYTNYVYPNWEWSSPNRLAEFYKRGYVQDVNNDINGLSYMLLFNLYVLNKGGYLGSINNPFYSEEFSHSFPNTSGGNIGSHALPYTYHSLEYLSSRSNLSSNAEVTFRNAKEINLLPGFKADHGATFLAYIEDYDCDNDPLAGSQQSDGSYDSFIPDDVFYSGLSPYEIVDVDENNPDYELDTTNIYEDSTWLADSILNSGDSTLIYWYTSVTTADTTEGGQSKPGRGNKTSFISNYRIIDNQSLTNYIRIYPNPTTGSLIVEIPVQGDYAIRVMNVLGITVYEGRMTGEQKKAIQLDGKLPPGNYTIHISGDKLRHVERITLIK